MFKRSLASLAAVAVASGAVVAPANAVTVTVNEDMTCNIQPTAEETRLTRLKQTTNLDKRNAANIKENIVKGQLTALRTKIEKDEKKLAELGSHSEESRRLRRELEDNKKKLTAYENLSNALTACINGQNYNSDQSGRPNNPDGSERPGGSKHPDGSERPGGSKHPDGSERPDDKRALPSTNGAVIGVIVAVLGILVAALPVIKSMLPAQLRALLP
ncbi:hypothetical protein FRC0293_01859 [Corynebacterium diphtheriae]|nr:hypothetical protein FRC0293_01859 [Corynebacterium diphtheriae]